MISYKNITFCPHYSTCATGAKCCRALTPDVVEAAAKWWGTDGAPIAQFAFPPDCYEHTHTDLIEHAKKGGPSK